MNECPLCHDKDVDLAYYKNELMCMNCAKDEMFKDGLIQREIEKHGH